jgi:ProP effector
MGHSGKDGAMTEEILSKAKQRATQKQAMLELLCVTFPACFKMYERARQPLKVGINADILARLGEGTDKHDLGNALRAYTNNVFYLKTCLVPGAERIDLDGNPTGQVSDEDRLSAQARLAGILEHQKQYRDAKRQERREEEFRAGLETFHQRKAVAEAKRVKKQKTKQPVKNEKMTATAPVPVPKTSPTPSPPQRKASSLSDLREAARRRRQEQAA